VININEIYKKRKEVLYLIFQLVDGKVKNLIDREKKELKNPDYKSIIDYLIQEKYIKDKNEVIGTIALTSKGLDEVLNEYPNLYIKELKKNNENLNEEEKINLANILDMGQRQKRICRLFFGQYGIEDECYNNEAINKIKNNAKKTEVKAIFSRIFSNINNLQKIRDDINENLEIFTLYLNEDLKLKKLSQPIKSNYSNFIDLKFNDFFHKKLKNEINSAFSYGLYTSTMLLSRKLIENLVIDVLRIKYPQNIPGNLEIYHNTKDGRFHDFTILLKNLEEKKDEFGIDKVIITEFISLIKPFRPRANADAHSIIMISDENEVMKYDITRMAALLLKLRDNI